MRSTLSGTEGAALSLEQGVEYALTEVEEVVDEAVHVRQRRIRSAESQRSAPNRESRLNAVNRSFKDGVEFLSPKARQNHYLTYSPT